jgi:hypothetical protein
MSTTTETKMTFTDALIASGYYFQPETGAFWKEDSNDNVHSYVEQTEGLGPMKSIIKIRNL